MKFNEKCNVIDDPELFIGYESGAIGMFKISLSEERNDQDQPSKFKFHKYFIAQKLIQDG